ncbi:hypothetical protein F7D01_13675 [Erythrobacter sp. 3-20A1M]|uniref:hypothetical protein n=1 Tax=Erythrobacter sp. 3-20A1M TaxID=2653850 RepID=UPI001BFC39ED|nr:hypothetical protein [Erythrobacter sp. 3-20A1M]QWC57971.1 hypothetical protein F7D01_13675 [Erythrobacter sp. 3-20A1M]
MASESTTPTELHERERSAAIREAQIAFDRCRSSDLDRNGFARLVELRDATKGLLAVLERELPSEGSTQREQRAFAFD